MSLRFVKITAFALLATFTMSVSSVSAASSSQASIGAGPWSDLESYCCGKAGGRPIYNKEGTRITGCSFKDGGNGEAFLQCLTHPAPVFPIDLKNYSASDLAVSE